MCNRSTETIVRLLTILALVGWLSACDSDSPAGELVDASNPGSSDTAAADVPAAPKDVEPSDTEAVQDTVASDNSQPPADASKPAPDLTRGPDTTDVTRVDDTTSVVPSDDLPMTWWRCRRLLITQQFKSSQQALCDSLYKTSPSKRLYGIRWVFHTDVPDTKAWVEPRLNFLNDRFQGSTISYETDSIAVVDNPVIVVTAGKATLPLSDYVSDIAQHLGIENSSASEVIDSFKKQLQLQSVAPSELDKITKDTKYTPQTLLRMLARVRPHVIHVVVAQKIDDAGGAGGMSSPPGTNPAASRVEIVNIRAAEKVGVLALPHEFGHFFGLKHPHGKKAEAGQYHQPMDVKTIIDKIVMGKSSGDALKSYLGNDLSGPLGDHYPAYDWKSNKTKPHTQEQVAIQKLWLQWRYLYFQGPDGPTPVQSLAAMFDAAQNKVPMYYKNLTGMAGPDAPGNTCQWDKKENMIACTMGDPPTVFMGTDSMLAGTLTFNEGQWVNIMSYIGKVLDTSYDNPQAIFSEQQIETMGVHANSPVRLMLHNRALKTE